MTAQDSAAHNSFNVGIVANVMSTLVLAFCGLAINFLITRFYGTEGLGLFNLVMALFITFSQFSTFGLHYSLLKYTAENSHKQEELKEILTSGIVLSFFISILVLGGCFIFWFFVEKIFHFHHLSEAWLITIPGVLFFGLNKNFLAFLNGQNRMLTFAGLTSLRYLSLLTVLLFLIYLSSPLYALAAMITFSELIVCLSCLWILRDSMIFSLNPSEWYKTHFTFGIKSFFAGAAIELNSKVDVLILSYFTNELFVGIYSIALFVVEGLLQFVVVVRNSLNPLITQYFYSHAYDQLERKIKKVCLFFFLVMLVLFFISIFFYYIYVFFTLSDHVLQAMIVFLILLIGLIFSVYYLPLQFFPNQIGNPSHQSYLNFFSLIGNVFLNTFFSYQYGLYGAAIATSLSFVLTAFIIRQYISTFLKKRSLERPVLLHS